jgi:N-acetylmuramoyl-L-alanine amidase
MIKKIICSSLLILAVPFLMSSVKAPVYNGPKKKSTINTIIIDAGHGGHDPGCRGVYSNEKTLALAIALKVGKKMEKELPNVKILYTRTTDTYPENKARAEFANANKGDLYISIHVNSAPKIKHRKFLGYKTETYYVGKGKNRKKQTRKVPRYSYYYTENPAKGTETYIWASDRTDAKGDFVTERMSEEFSENGEGAPDINDPEFKAKSLLWTKRYFDKSLMLASLVEEEFVKNGRTSRGVKQRNDKGIWVLQATAMPSILVETGFITHRPEEDYLNSKKGQEEIATNIVNAVKRFREASDQAVTKNPASNITSKTKK